MKQDDWALQSFRWGGSSAWIERVCQDKKEEDILQSKVTSHVFLCSVCSRLMTKRLSTSRQKTCAVHTSSELGKSSWRFWSPILRPANIVPEKDQSTRKSAPNRNAFELLEVEECTEEDILAFSDWAKILRRAYGEFDLPASRARVSLWQKYSENCTIRSLRN